MNQAFFEKYRFIHLEDFLLLPFYLIAIHLIAERIQEVFYPKGHPWRKYFFRGLWLKIGGALVISFVYQYYYGGGDTGNYFIQSQHYREAFSDNPALWVKLFLHQAEWYEGEFQRYFWDVSFYTSMANHVVVAFTAVCGILTFNTFLPIAVIFAALSYSGVWALFRTFASRYPHLTPKIALAVLYLPSALIWGSGVFKDTLCLMALGWLTFCTFRMLIQREFSIFNVLIMAGSLYLLYLIKVYILLAFVPAIIMWTFFTYSSYIKSRPTRQVINLILLPLLVGGSFLAMSRFTNELGKYSLEKLVSTSGVTRNYIVQQSGDEGSAYDLGAVPNTLGGMLLKMPAAVNVTLFRPYIWEAGKAIVLLNSLESMLFLFITLRLIAMLGFKRIASALREDPTIQFLLIFTIIFAFAVGISSYNFGALSRYRIPCLPFFSLALVLVFYRYNPPERKIIATS